MHEILIKNANFVSFQLKFQFFISVILENTEKIEKKKKK